MFICRLHLICLVKDMQGNEDMIDVTSLDDVPSRWVYCKVMKEYRE
jgi:hypothetical protein